MGRWLGMRQLLGEVEGNACHSVTPVKTSRRLSRMSKILKMSCWQNFTESTSIMRRICCPYRNTSSAPCARSTGWRTERRAWAGARGVCVGGLDTIQRELDLMVEKHGENCGEGVHFAKGENCLLAICSSCDFCQTFGGFWCILVESY